MLGNVFCFAATACGRSEKEKAKDAEIQCPCGRESGWMCS